MLERPTFRTLGVHGHGRKHLANSFGENSSIYNVGTHYSCKHQKALPRLKNSKIEEVHNSSVFFYVLFQNLGELILIIVYLFEKAVLPMWSHLNFRQDTNSSFF